MSAFSDSVRPDCTDVRTVAGVSAGRRIAVSATTEPSVVSTSQDRSEVDGEALLFVTFITCCTREVATAHSSSVNAVVTCDMFMSMNVTDATTVGTMKAPGGGAGGLGSGPGGGVGGRRGGGCGGGKRGGSGGGCGGGFEGG